MDIRRQINRFLAGLGLAAAFALATAAPSHATINDCGTTDGTPDLHFGLFDSPCADLGLYEMGVDTPGGLTIPASGDTEAIVEAALADLGIAVDISLIEKVEDGASSDFTFYDLDDGAPSYSALPGNDPTATDNGGWDYDGPSIISFMSVKAAPGIFRLFRYTPAASDGRYSSLGIINHGGQQANVSHISFWTGTPEEVPEPGALSLFAIGLAGLAVMRRRRKTA